jgi:hypothetical protein
MPNNISRMSHSNNQLSPEEKQRQQEGYQVKELVAQPGWQLLKAWLEHQINHSWVDPRQFKTEQELTYAYSVAWGFAQGAQGILDEVQKWVDDAEQLTAKEQGKHKDLLRESMQ